MFPSSSGKVFAAKQSEQKKKRRRNYKDKGKKRREEKFERKSWKFETQPREGEKRMWERGVSVVEIRTAAADLEEGWRGGRGSVARFGTSALLFSGNEVVFL